MRRIGLAVVAFLLLGLAAPAAWAGTMPATILNFPGMSDTSNLSPPDSTGAVGPNNYVQVTNLSFEVFNKDGSVAQAARATNSLWSGYSGANAGNGCATRNDGDAVVRYDAAADRWIVGQPSWPHQSTTGGPSFECVAVSQTGDPTGAYWRYDFEFPYSVIDQPKIGVWSDGYYVAANVYDGSTFTYKGVDVCALDRAAMLSGTAETSATEQCFLIAAPSSPPACPATQPFTAFGVLPASLEGSLPPPSGSPEYLMQFDGSQCNPPYNKLDLWKLHIDWNTPANSALSAPTPITVDDFTPICSSTPSGHCIPQPGVASSAYLDGIGQRLMDRLVYRNFGDHESLLVNHTVTSSGVAGIRWYEIRDPGGTPTVYQQGTFSPDANNWRWAGSIDQDQAGDIALGYSISSAGSPGVAHPSIAWAGRLAGDPLGTFGQTENIIDSGAFNDTQFGQRWGDYSSMTIDPSDDCTFWYTNELYSASSTHWSTAIASTKFPNCARNDFSIAASPAVSALQGAGGSTTVSTTSTKGAGALVALNAYDLPAGATASFNPATVTAGQTSTLTLTAGPATPPGTYTVEVAGTAPSAVHGTTVSFTVNAAHQLTVLKSASGSGTVTSQPQGIDCGSTCSSPFAAGQSVTLTASPATGSLFIGWSGAGCSGHSTCLVTMDADKSVTAVFDTRPVCKNRSVSVTFNTPKKLSLGCSHARSTTLRWVIVRRPAHGVLSKVSSSGAVTYTPRKGYSGPDSFTFKAIDSHGISSKIATVGLKVLRRTAMPALAAPAVS